MVTNLFLSSCNKTDNLYFSRNEHNNDIHSVKLLEINDDTFYRIKNSDSLKFVAAASLLGVNLRLQ